MMEEIGKTLQETREQLGLTLEEVERATRIRIHHLERLEKGEIDSLPSGVHARGFLRNYAEFLGLEAEDILLQYAEQIQSRRSRAQNSDSLGEPATRPSVQVLSRRPRWLSSDLFVAAAITIAILAVLIWGGSRAMASLRARTEAAEEASGLLLPTPTITETSLPTEAAPTEAFEQPAEAAPAIQSTATPTLPLLPEVAGAVNVRILAERRVWVRVLADGDEIFQGRLVPGEFVEAQGVEVVEVVAGNGSAVRAFYNGQDRGLLGGPNEVVVLLWTLDGELTPTPTETRPPTETPPATNTPPASP